MRRVLIIDDAMFMRQMLKNALEQVGFEVVGEAKNGIEGLDLFNKLKPDLTTLDIVMPEMDGIEVLTKIRETNTEAKIVMVTAVDQREPMLTAMKLGVTDFIVKPFNDDRIISVAEKALGKN